MTSFHKGLLHFSVRLGCSWDFDRELTRSFFDKSFDLVYIVLPFLKTGNSSNVYQKQITWNTWECYEKFQFICLNWYVFERFFLILVTDNFFCCLDLVIIWLPWGRETVFDLELHWLSWTEFPVNFFVENFEAWRNIWLGQGIQFELMLRNQKLGYTQTSSKLASTYICILFLWAS